MAIKSTPLEPAVQARLIMIVRGLTSRAVDRLFEPAGVTADAVIRAAAGLPILPATHVAIVLRLRELESQGAGPRRDI